MKFLLLIALLISSPRAATGEPRETAAADSPSRAWLGLQVSKPDSTLAAQFPTLPPGVGFVLRSIDSKGPAAAAGLREYDILWKIGDQMLVNEAQLATLLNLHQPGDEIVLSGFRAGKPIDVTVKLGSAPAGSPAFPGEMVDEIILPGGCGGPMRVVNRSERTASYTNDEGTVEVRRENSIYHVAIRDADGAFIYQGELTASSEIKDVPQKWRRRVSALCRGLDHVLDGHLAAPRQPRPRVVPPAAANDR